MIKKLRKRFTIVAMCSMIAVIATIVVVFNVMNYVRYLDGANHKIRMIEENDGKFPTPSSKKTNTKKKKEEDASEEKKKPPKEEKKKMSPEDPYRTRYFSVQMDEEGNVTASNLQSIAAISSEEAEQYAKEIFAGKKTRGFLDIYRYKRIERENGVMVIFLDSKEELETYHMNLLTSVTVSLAALLAVFILVVFFSKIVFLPIAKSYEKQKQFITDASHEIKTPLTIIDADVEVIEMEHGENEWTKSIRKQIRRLTEFTQQLVTLTKLDEEGIWLQKSEFSLSDVVREGIHSFEGVTKISKKTVETDIQERIVMQGDEKSIRQLIHILMDNAVKYSLPESVIFVSLGKKGKRIQFSLCNETENIPQGNLDMLFERFYRLDASRNSENGGSGIGLSVAQAIVESHHGKIRARSEDGKSLWVHVEF